MRDARNDLTIDMRLKDLLPDCVFRPLAIGCTTEPGLVRTAVEYRLGAMHDAVWVECFSPGHPVVCLPGYTHAARGDIYPKAGAEA